MPTKSTKPARAAKRTAKKTTKKVATRAKATAKKARATKAPAKKAAARKAPARKAASKATAAKRTAKKATTRAAAVKTTKKSGSSARGRRPDAIALLKEEHREVAQLFKRFEQAGDGAEREKRRLVDAMTTALSKHAAIEERVLYPWARDTVRGIDDDVLESFEEHRLVKWLLSELRTMDPADERFDAKVTVTIELVRHHVEEEESELFPTLRRAASRAQLLELGDRLRTAKKVAPPVPDLGPAGVVGAAVEHARDVGKGVVDRIGALTGVE